MREKYLVFDIILYWVLEKVLELQWENTDVSMRLKQSSSTLFRAPCPYAVTFISFEKTKGGIEKTEVSLKLILCVSRIALFP